MESIFGIHESALLYRARRMDVLARNLANADTPQYKARDVEFAQVLAGVGGVRSVSLARTNERHIAASAAAATEGLRYRVPYQPSLDGNTVEADLELARFAENSVAYQASLMFLNGRVSTLRQAITGSR
jgi:flagellar basal-body rod protein FlgB